MKLLLLLLYFINFISSTTVIEHQVIIDKLGGAKLSEKALNYEKQKNIITSLPTKSKTVDIEVALNTAATEMLGLIDDRAQATIRLANSAKTTDTEGTNGNTIKCCDTTTQSNELSYNAYYNMYVDPQMPCSRGSCRLSSFEISNRGQLSGEINCAQSILKGDFVETVKDNAPAQDGSAWQYFGSETGVMTNYPRYISKDGQCPDNFDPRWRPWYLNGLCHNALDIVIIFDKSGTMTDNNRIVEAKKAMKAILHVLRPIDRVALAGFASPGDHDTRTNIPCQSEELTYATKRNVKELSMYIDTIVPKGNTYYSFGLKYAEDFFSKTKPIVGEKTERLKLLMFLSDGAPTESKNNVMIRLKETMTKIPELIVLTYGIDYNGDILEDMANHNYAKYGIPNSATYKQGNFEHLPTEALMLKLRKFYSLPSIKSPDNSVAFSSTYADAMGMGIMVTASQSVVKNNILYGVVGYDITLDYLLKPLLNVESERIYSFFIEDNGNVIYHPLMAKSDKHMDTVHFNLMETDTEIVEKIDSIRKADISDFVLTKSRHKTFISDNNMRIHGNNSNIQNYDIDTTESKNPLEQIKIACKLVDSNYTVTKFVLCIVESLDVLAKTVDDDAYLNQGKSIQSYINEYDYHIQNVNEKYLCNHGFRRSTKVINKIGTGIKYSPRQYKEPTRYIVDRLPESMIDKSSKIKQVLFNGERNNLFENLAQVQASTKLMIEIGKVWFEQDEKFGLAYGQSIKNSWLPTSTQKEMIHVWSYFGASDGTFRSHPPIQFAAGFDPTKRGWYKLAITNPNITFISTPYVDGFGMGYVNTVCRAVKYPDGEVAGVLATDYFTSQFETLLNMSPCDRSSTTCILMDSTGAIVYWRYMTENQNIIYPKRLNTNLDQVSDILMADAIFIEGKHQKQLFKILMDEYNIKTTKCHNTERQTTKIALDLKTATFDDKVCKTSIPGQALCHPPMTNLYLFVADSTSRYVQRCKEPSRNELGSVIFVEQRMASVPDTYNSNCAGENADKVDEMNLYNKENGYETESKCHCSNTDYMFLTDPEDKYYNPCINRVKSEVQGKKLNLPLCQGGSQSFDISNIVGSFDRYNGYSKAVQNGWSWFGKNCYSWMDDFPQYAMYPEGRLHLYKSGATLFQIFIIILLILILILLILGVAWGIFVYVKGADVAKELVAETLAMIKKEDKESDKEKE